MDPEYMENRLGNTIDTTNEPNEKRALQELRAARKLQLKRINAQAQADKELQNFEAAKANGTVVECGCCFDDFALNRMVRCQGLESAHTAENVVGQSKYELVCMSMDQCKAGFSRNERRKFLTDHLSAALDRIENEAILRMAGIENLERCPFCPYAAEYPPVESNREFRCDNPDCQKVSCRLCKEETHIPKTCEEVARDNGIGARHEIEEAMSAALIRKCNKCGTLSSKKWDATR
ncbi:RING finger protein [Colletotrichum tofieldiae]|nr:RING finger protein [Colletotrichum tofieldiae]